MPDKDMTDKLWAALERMSAKGADDQQIADQCNLVGSELHLELGVAPIGAEDLIAVIRRLLARQSAPTGTPDKDGRLNEVVDEIVGQLNDADDKDGFLGMALDDLVHELASSIGSDVNNGGFDEQVKFILKELGLKHGRKAIEQAASEAGLPLGRKRPANAKPKRRNRQ